MSKLRDITCLSLNEKQYAEFDLFSPDQAPTTLRYLPGVSAINVFVGANHSGKSRFLRALARDFSFRFIPAASERDWSNTREKLDHMLSAVERLQGTQAWQTYRDAKHLSSLLHDLQVIASQVERRREDIAELLDVFRQDQVPPGFWTLLDRVARDPTTADLASQTYAALGDLSHPSYPQSFQERELTRMYMPVLRGLRLFREPESGKQVHEDHYLHRTREDYFHDAGHVEIFTGYLLYRRIQDMLLGRKDERRQVREYETFLSETFFENKEITLTPHRDGVLHVTIDGEEQAIHDVGDGLQSAIILTFEPFMRRDQPCLFFIEEPELFLHPGLQRHIIEFFLDCTNHLFFFTTHSNHFLGMSFDYDGISIYNFQRNALAPERDKARFLVTPVSRGDRGSLELLGVRNSSVFLVNATIWVEGITDRRYMRKFLELFRRHCAGGGAAPDEDISRLEEDIHYAFVEYGGANLKHWSFQPSGDAVSGQAQENDAPIEVQTLCARAFLVRDDDEISSSDRKKSKRAQNDELEASLGERFARTPGREIENLLPARVLEHILGEAVAAARPDMFPLQRERYRNERLGEFLDGLAGVNGKWGDEYGTLKRKNDFCSKAVEHLDGLAFADLDDEVQDLVKRICRFLVAQNRFVIAPQRS